MGLARAAGLDEAARPVSGSVDVLVEAWQQQCCGVDFGTGSGVEWTASRITDDPNWISTVLGHTWGERVRFVEGHHADGEVSLSGTVTAVRELSCTLEPVPGRPDLLRAAAGGGRLTRIEVIDKWGPRLDDDSSQSAGIHFVGWIVTLTLAGDCAGGRGTGPALASP